MKLGDIVELWRETLAPEAALAALNAASKLPRATWPERPKDLHAEWIKRAKKPNDETIAELMRVSDFAKHTAKQLLERIELMNNWKPHPIATRWMVDVLARQTRAPLLDGQKCFRRVFNLLVDHIDKAGAEKFESWIGTHQERIAASAFGAQFFDDGIKRVLAKSQERRAEARELTQNELDALEKAGLLVEPPEPPREVTIDALLAAVYEAPWDDGPRLVLADYLQQRDDPRGELIAIDLLPEPTPAQTKQRNALIRKHGKGWFPEALDKIVKRSAEYERGFLAFGELMTTERPVIELATFRELEIGWGSGVPQFDHAAFRGVESWLGVLLPDDHDLRVKRWCEHAPVPRVRRLGVTMRMGDPTSDFTDLVRPDAWPNVTELVVELTYHFGWTDASLPSIISDLPRVLAAHMPQVMHLDIRPFARFDRSGQILTELFLPAAIASSLTSNSEYTADARRRWIDWMRALGVPIVIEGPRNADELLPLLAGCQVSAGKPRPLAKLGKPKI